MAVTITEEEDTEGPIITGGENGNAECTGSDPSINAEYISWRDDFAGVSASDACSNVTLSYTESPWTSAACADEIVISIVATDDQGNMTSTEFSFRIADTTPPVLTGGADGSAESTGARWEGEDTIRASQRTTSPSWLGESSGTRLMQEGDVP